MFTLNAGLSMYSSAVAEAEPAPENLSEKQAPAATRDTVQTNHTTKFPVSKTVVEDYEDVIQKYPIDLRTPGNLETQFEYDPASDTYLMRTKIGDSEVVTPFTMTREQYLKYTMEQSLQQYFRQRNEEEVANQDKTQTFSPFDMKFDLGPAEKLFGPGGVQLQMNGSVDLKAAITRTSNGNPTQSANNRSRMAFDFEEQIQANVKAKVGDKINFDMNYNTQATFDFDSKKLKLAYQGKEDEILKLLEAGNVSMTTSNSLINGGAALFGIKADLQFGKLKVGAIFSQQESESKTVSSNKGVQTTPFEITADAYDENQHFFLAQYFRDNYDKAMSTLPFIKSPISIERIEVWVMNGIRAGNSSNTDNARNIVAFTDLGEHQNDPKHMSNPSFVSSTGIDIPYNGANDLYDNIVKNFSDARNINNVISTFTGTGLENGQDYEIVGNARRLNESEYTLNKQLGYISLRTKLDPDAVLAVAFAFTYRGQAYQLGELSTSDNSDNPDQSLYLKLLKSTNVSPGTPIWNLMMKNVYSLNTYSLQKDKFKLDIMYLNDSTGVYLNYISEGNIKNKPLLRVMNLDRLDSNNNPRPDGFFDYVEGFTVSPSTGRIIFPVKEPFGSHLTDSIKNDDIAGRYVFQELYDSTLTVARQIANKNKFIMRGEYRGSGASSGDIDLGAYNVARGSVRVTSNGQLLTEGVDYTVDYASGKVTLAQNIADSGAPVSVSLENQSMYGMQRKTMTGLNLEYQFNPNFNLGATIMNLSEMPVTMKVNMGEESVNNTIYGFNANWKTESQWLTNMLDKLPLLNLTAPSQINFSAEFAQLIPSHSNSKFGGNFSYIDDFERTKIPYDLTTPQSWSLASTPYGRFQEAGPEYMGKIEYGNNRALLAWYTIDPMFTRRRNNLTPDYLKNDTAQLSNHYVREVSEMELFPDKYTSMTEPSMIPIFNLAYYPTERGPYNLDTNMNPDGTLQNPEQRWGGIMRRLEKSQTDFEASNIEFIEFWLLDPFIYNTNAKGGDLYFNLGEISEDILKDGRIFYENGLPVDGDTTAVDTTVWGKVPTRQPIVYAFDNNPNNLRKQDVGLNGLSTEEEKKFSTYVNYLNKLEYGNILDPGTIERMKSDPFSPFNDPAGDNYHHFRGPDYDAQKASILYRYKRFNGTEGNSQSIPEYDTSAKTTPDVEDANQDLTLNQSERYYEYHVELSPKQLQVGSNFIVDKRTAPVTLRNGRQTEVDWYQFKIPIKTAGKAINGIRDFRSIRFMRMYMTNFTDSVVLRFGTLALVRGSWRAYTQDLSLDDSPSTTGTIDISAVNTDENSKRTPVNYVLPPGVNRAIDPGQTQINMLNEQSLDLKIRNLEHNDARAVFQAFGLDTRQYKRLQMFVHAEKFIDDDTDLRDDDLTIFLRLGSDYKENYYEYEIPLKLTPPGNYSSYITSDQLAVWPAENMFDFPFETLTNLKLKRNRERSKNGSAVAFSTRYTEIDPDKPNNKVTVIGNPTLSDVKVIMIGVRNNAKTIKSGEVWVNELRVTDFNEDGGWAANANLNIALSDLGTINLAGRTETTGFGSLEQGLMDRNMDDFYQYNVSANIELGKLFPEKAKVSIPMFYTYSNQTTSPKYNPLDQDILLTDALNAATTKAEKDSIKNYSQEVISTKSISFSNIKVAIKSKNPMPWDPDNFNLNYSFAENLKKDPTTDHEINTNTRIGFGYSYSPYIKPFTPFKDMKSKSGSTKFLREFSLNYLPNSFTFNSEMSRDYYEIQLRDLNNSGEDYAIKPSFRDDFVWNRTASLQWNLTKNLNLSIQTGTQARIDAHNPNDPKYWDYDAYMTNWKDSIWRSILDLGTPLSYAQTFNATYNIPFRSIPILDFATASLSYNAIYNWDRGAEIADDSLQVGNTIKNERTFSINNVNLNLLNLYNKSDFLKKANQRFTMKRPSTVPNQRSTNTTNRPQTTPVKKEIKKYEGQVQLSRDSATVVSHKLNNKRILVTARRENGKLYDLRFKIVDANSIKISNKDSVNLKLVITQLPPLEEAPWYKTAQVIARGAMMVRSVGFTYSLREGLTLPGFSPNIGGAWGQGQTNSGNAPGFDFAFGLTDDSYIQKAFDRGWMIDDIENNEYNIVPATFSSMETFTFKASLEPIVGLKIDLNAKYSTTNSKDMNFITGGKLSTRFGGMFDMTTVAIGSAFGSSKSQAFDVFLNNRKTVRNRLVDIYRNMGHGSVADNISLNSADVLIPSFIAAYTKKSSDKIALTAFPSLKSILPNWRMTYDGFMQLDFISQNFKNFTLSHEYTCRYVVGSYASFLSWWQEEGDYSNFGFITNLNNESVPSSPFDISTVSITEAFSPLVGLNATFKNNMSLKMEMRNTRNVSLNIPSRIVELNSDDYVVGIGYKLTEFNKVLKMRKSGGAGFSNDLTISADFSYKRMISMIRTIQDAFTQGTSGDAQTGIKISADYNLSKMLTLQAFFDRASSQPLVSTTAFPFSKSSFGIDMKLKLSR